MVTKTGISMIENGVDEKRGRQDEQVVAEWTNGPTAGDSGAAMLLPGSQSWIVRAARWLLWLVSSVVAGIFGFLSIVLLMSILATVPLLQFLSLGYLLEAGARVAESGRLRDGFVGIAGFRRVAGVLIAGYVLFIPVRLLADVRNSAALLEAGSGRTVFFTALTIAVTMAAIWHIGWAVYRGGKLRSFLWPAPIKCWRTLRSSGVSGMYVDARDRLWNHFVAMRVPYFFWLGLRGFAIALAWLAVPVTVLVLGSRSPEGLAVLLSLVGGVLLLTVLFYLPFLQVNFARTDSIANGFRWRLVRQQFGRAPIAFWLALVATLVLAVPLYLLKAELVPREAAWLPSLVFVLSIFPTRLLAGWALGRAERRNDLRHWLFRWVARFAALPIVAAYVAIVYVTQYTSWYGVWSLYEQHAFLLPVPFLGF